MLRAQNGDLSAKLHRTEIFLSRVKEELAYFRTSNGKTSDINFDEEQRLNIKLKVSTLQMKHDVLKRVYLLIF